MVTFKKTSDYQKRQLEKISKIHVNQPSIINFLQEEIKLKKVMQENVELNRKIKDLNNERAMDQLSSNFLRDLVTLNQAKAKFYSEDIKKFCVKLYLQGGALLYNTLYAALEKKFPCLSTIQKYINSKEDFIYTQGALKIESCITYLRKCDYGVDIFLSEDMTKVKPRRRYCSYDDSIVGLVMPLDPDNGMPLLDVFKFISIENSMALIEKYKIAEYINVLMVQPIKPNSSPYCALIYGADSSYSFQLPMTRWLFLQSVFKSYGINVWGK